MRYCNKCGLTTHSAKETRQQKHRSWGDWANFKKGSKQYTEAVHKIGEGGEHLGNLSKFCEAFVGTIY